MTDSETAEKRRNLGFPSEGSRREEYRQVIRDWLYHDKRIQELGPKKAFFHIVERARLERILESYGYDDET